MQAMKNIMVFKFNEPFAISNNDLENLLLSYPLRNCLEMETETYGFIPAYPSGKNNVEEINNSLFIRIGMHVKKISRKAVKTEVDRIIKENYGDLTVSRVRYKEIEEEVYNSFVSKTPQELDSIIAYIDKEKQWLVIDAGSEKKSALVTSLLRKALGSLPVSNHAPQATMSNIFTEWVRDNLPSDDFSFTYLIDLAELSKEDGGVARYRGIPIDSKEIESNINDGWQVTKLGLDYQENVSFVLGVDFVLKSIKYSQEFSNQVQLSDDENATSQSNAFLMVDLTRSLIPDLFKLCYQGD